MKFIKIFMVILFFLLNNLSAGESMIPESCRIDWSNAGLTIPRSIDAVHLININDYTGSDDNKISQALVDAANFCELTIIYFPSGTYTFTQTVDININHSNVVIQGAGTDLTKFNFTNDKCDNCFTVHGNSVSDSRNISYDIPKGSNEIYVSNTTNYNVGDWVQIYESENPDAWWSRDDGTSGYGKCGQIGKVTSITVDSYISIDQEASKEYKVTSNLTLRKMNPVQNFGIENLAIERTEAGNGFGTGSTIFIGNAINCWIRGVESIKAVGRHLSISTSAHLEISGCYFHDAYYYNSGTSCGGIDGKGYGIVMSTTSTNCLIENNILENYRHALLTANGANCNVFAYNYTIDTDNVAISSICLHGQYSYSNLFEHNFVENIEADDTHGANGPYNAILRNYIWDDEDDVWGTIIIDNAPNTAVLGCKVQDGGQGGVYKHGTSQYPSSYSIEGYGWYSYEITWFTHQQADFWYPNSNVCTLSDDISHFYQTRPYFLSSNFTFPSLGARISSSTITNNIPARTRYSQSEKTYIDFLTQHNSNPNRVMPSSKNVVSTSGSTTFVIENSGFCDNLMWTASDNADWVTLSPVSGSLTVGQTQILTVNFDANPNNMDRNCTITILYSGQSDLVSILQYAKTTTSGTLTSNENWRTNVTLTGDVTIPSGITLTIQPGNTVTMPDYREMYVYGTLHAVGTSSNHIVFTSADGTNGNSENAYLIRFNNTSSNNSRLEYCTLQYAQRGVYFYYSSADIKNSTINGCNYGIYNNHGNPYIYNNDISVGGYGIYNYYSSPYEIIKSNNIDVSSYGIYNYRSSPDIQNNVILNSAFGIRCNSYSSPQMGTYSQAGNNKIHNHFMYGMDAIDNSNPFLGGADNCGPDGRNSFDDNLEGHITAGSNCSIIAENNWWGTSNPQSWMFWGDVDYIPYLTSSPSFNKQGTDSPEESAFDKAFTNSETEGSSPISYYNPKWNLTQKTRFAHALIYTGYPEDAQQICQEIIENYPDSAKAFFALDLYWQASRQENTSKGYDEEAFKTYLSVFSLNKGKKELYGSSELLLAGFEGEEGLKRIEKVYAEYQDTYLSEMALFQEFMFYLNDKEDEKTARALSDQLDKEYPGSSSALQAHHLLGDEVKEWSIASNNKLAPEENDIAETEQSVPEKYSLNGAYPNPFNPTTNIKYSLPAVSKVEIYIFNSIGQKINHIKRASQNTGHWQITWDGTKQNGQSVPSGVYFIKFKAVSLEKEDLSFEESIKVTLIR